MSPRPYNLARRRQASDETRARIVKAARELLGSRAGATRFSIDAVAQRAGVARMTVYYQFKSKRGLLDALYDDIARSGQIDQLAQAFQQDDPISALDTYIRLFGRFWTRERLVLRRIRALGALDAEVEASLRQRDSWRLGGLRVLVGRLRPDASAEETSEAVRTLYAMTSFEAFDVLAGEERSPLDVVPLVQRLGHLLLAPD